MKNIEAGGQFPVPVQSRLFGRGDVMTRDTKKPVEMNTGERRDVGASLPIQARPDPAEELRQIALGHWVAWV
jgi:hypothetical protein